MGEGIDSPPSPHPLRVRAVCVCVCAQERLDALRSDVLRSVEGALARALQPLQQRLQRLERRVDEMSSALIQSGAYQSNALDRSNRTDTPAHASAAHTQQGRA